MAEITSGSLELTLPSACSKSGNLCEQKEDQKPFKLDKRGEEIKQLDKSYATWVKIHIKIYKPIIHNANINVRQVQTSAQKQTIRKDRLPPRNPQSST